MKETTKRHLKQRIKTHRSLENKMNMFGGVWALFWWVSAIYISNITYFTPGAVGTGDHMIAMVFFIIAITETKDLFKKGNLKKKADMWERHIKEDSCSKQ